MSTFAFCWLPAWILFSVYNEDDNDLYVHHDILLGTFPLVLEWLNFDPEEERKTGIVNTVYSNISVHHI